MLHDLARSLGADIRLDSEVIDVNPALAQVKLKDGGMVEGDTIIGADGAHGICRRLLFEQESVAEPGHRFTCYA